jgi:hypothetical protein
MPERPEPTQVKFTAARGRARREGYADPLSTQSKVKNEEKKETKDKKGEA